MLEGKSFEEPGNKVSDDDMEKPTNTIKTVI